MKKFSIIASVSGAVLAASLSLAGPAAAFGGAHDLGPVGAGGGFSTAAPAGLPPAPEGIDNGGQAKAAGLPPAPTAPATSLPGGFAPAGVDNGGTAKAASLPEAPAAGTELPIAPVGQ